MRFQVLQRVGSKAVRVDVGGEITGSRGKDLTLAFLPSTYEEGEISNNGEIAVGIDSRNGTTITLKSDTKL